MTCFKIPGFIGAIIELAVFAAGSSALYLAVNQPNKIDPITYYWCIFTVLTGLWESAYIISHKQSVEISNRLVDMDLNVWTERYSLSMLLPWNFFVIFYGEYGAFADREYMTNKDIWSRSIEGTHAIFCGLFSLAAIILYYVGQFEAYNITLSVAMGSQLMNSILYMGQYYIETKNKNSVNYNNSDFQLGTLWYKRPFMYVNLFWTIMPIYSITRQLYNTV